MIYSGLFSEDPISTWARLALALAAAALAFVGAVSALSITRAFGVTFLGSARDASLPDAQEANAWMLFPMGIHAAGTVVLGVAPTLGFALVAAPTAHFLRAGTEGVGMETLQALVVTLTRIGAISALLITTVIIALWLRKRVLRAVPMTNATWGCGYTAPNVRMQYTGASFGVDFANRFEGILHTHRHQQAPSGYFPLDSHISTDCVDAVEKRLYSVIGQGNDTATELSRLMHEDDPRLAFAAGLAAIVAISALILLTEGALP
jgi:hydrogenase-4 component B